MSKAIFDIINSLGHTKKNLLAENPELEKEYNSFMVNKAFSQHVDTIGYANEMNMRWQYLDAKHHYDFYLHTVRPKKRYGKWAKKDLNNDVDIVKEYYGFNTQKAEQALRVLSKEQLQFIRSKLETGG